jgi:Sec7 domain
MALSVEPGDAIDGDAAARVRGPSPASDKAAELAGRKAKKKMRADGIALFNAKPKKGIRQLQAQGLLDAGAAEVAQFLRQAEGLDYAAVGEYLSEPDEESKAVRAVVNKLLRTALQRECLAHALASALRASPGDVRASGLRGDAASLLQRNTRQAAAERVHRRIMAPPDRKSRGGTCGAGDARVRRQPRLHGTQV